MRAQIRRVSQSLFRVPWLLTVAAIAIAFLFRSMVPSWPPRAWCADAACQEAREWISFTVTALAILGGLFQYWRGQQWKRAEFLAGEMRAFLDTPAVHRAFVMIDWGERNVNLHDLDTQEVRKWPLVTRDMQVTALLPHPVANVLDRTAAGEPANPERSDVSAGSLTGGDLRGFTEEEAAIRDCYDALLDGLERFASFAATGLITTADLRPYLAYWIDDMASTSGDEQDLEWSAAFFSFVEYYGYSGVQLLFSEFGYDVHSTGTLFKRFAEHLRAGLREPVLKTLAERRAQQAAMYARSSA